MKHIKLTIIFAIIVFFLDQITKFWAVTFITKPIEVTPFLNFALAYNYGVSFSLFYELGSKSPIPLVIISILVVLFITWVYRRESSKTARILLGMFIGAGLGNITDRARLGYVVDFIDAHAFGYHWPTFNIADSCLTIIMILLVWDTFFNNKRKKK